MARRNADQLDLLAYRPPRAAKPKRRKLGAVKVKFGPASNRFTAYDDTYEFDILARRGSGDWVVVGDVEVIGVDVSSDADRSTDYRVGEYRARFTSSYMEALLELGDDAEYDVEVMTGGNYFRGTRSRVKRTTAEAKRMIKDWVAETLEALGWEG